MKRPVSEEFKETFARLTRYAPAEIQNDKKLKKKALLFMALGGEPLVRQYIETFQKQFPERLFLFDKALNDDTLKEDDEVQTAGTENNED